LKYLVDLKNVVKGSLEVKFKSYRLGNSYVWYSWIDDAIGDV